MLWLLSMLFFSVFAVFTAGIAGAMKIFNNLIGEAGQVERRTEKWKQKSSRKKNPTEPCNA